MGVIICEICVAFMLTQPQSQSQKIWNLSIENNFRYIQQQQNHLKWQSCIKCGVISIEWMYTNNPWFTVKPILSVLKGFSNITRRNNQNSMSRVEIWICEIANMNSISKTLGPSPPHQLPNIAAAQVAACCSNASTWIIKWQLFTKYLTCTLI